MTGLDPRDQALQAHTPTVMVPRFGPMPRLDTAGHRFLAARDGIWLEVLRPWLYLCTPVGFLDLDLPYGELKPIIEYAFPAEELLAITRRFAQDAAEAMPNECAAWAVWDCTAQRLVYRPLLAIHASDARIKFHRPALADHELLAIDIHSHGADGPYFSHQDDEDDCSEVKFSVVGGRFNGQPEFKSRLCALGVFLEAE